MAKGKGGFLGQDGLNAPDAPTGVSGTAGDTQVTVSFTAPSDVGGSAITGYNVQAADGSGSWQSSYYIQDASYDGISLDVSGEDSWPLGMAFNTDGTKLYVIGIDSDNVYQYTLSAAFDLSTASYDSVSFSVSSQDSVPYGIAFNSDGTKMYMSGGNNRSVYQYTLSTAFDLSTASYDSVSFSTFSQTPPRDVEFNTAGTKMYITGDSNRVYQYTLSTAFNLSTASYDSVSLDVSSQESSIAAGIAFNSDGTKMYLAGYGASSVFQYTLSTAFDLSTASYDSVSLNVSGQETNPYDLAFNSDGTKMYLVGRNDSVYQYTTVEVDYPTASPVTITGLTNGTSYTFNVWAINAFGWSSPSDASGSVSPVAPPLGFFAGGSSEVDTIDQFTITTLGNSTDFGNLTIGRRAFQGSMSSATRAVFGSGYTGAYSNVMDYITMATAGDATDFGDYGYSAWGTGSLASSTRGIISGGVTSGGRINAAEYITIASTGNGTDFGDMTTIRAQFAALSSPTRGINAMGSDGGDLNIIDYCTIATTGNFIDFGDVSSSERNTGGCSNATRGLFHSGVSSLQGSIVYITIASTGNTTSFGDLQSSTESQDGCASSTRALINESSEVASGNKVTYVEIATTGNSVDFGDLTGGNRREAAGASSAHGGLQ